LLSVLTILLIMVPASPAAADRTTNRIPIEFLSPTNPAHQPLYDMIRQEHALEKLP
jgi:hypothetical protein